MKKSYLFIYNPSLGNREEIKEFVSSCDIIKTWRFELVGSFFLVSEHSAEILCEEIRNYFGDKKGKYVVTELTDNTQGMLEERSWNLINDKKLPSKNKS